MRKLLAMLGGFLVLGGAPAPAQQRQVSQPPQLTPGQLDGEWTGTLALDNSTPHLALVFAAKDSTFTGKVYNEGEVMGDMEDGRITGDRVHFKVGRLDFTGVVSGPRMQVDLIVYNGSTRKLRLIKTPDGASRTPVGIWRGTSVCLVRPSACNDEVVVYRITPMKAADSLAVDARKIVRGEEQDMGVLGCRLVPLTGQVTCAIPQGAWHFMVRNDSLTGELRLVDNSRFREVRAIRAP